MSSHASCIGCRSRPTVAGRPSIVVISSVDLICETGTQHGLNALPLMWHVHALQTPRPQPYFGPLTPRTSRRTHSRRTSPSTSALTRLPLRMKVWIGMGSAPPPLRALLLAHGLLVHLRLGQAVGRRLRDRRHGRVGLEAQGAVVVEREA